MAAEQIPVANSKQAEAWNGEAGRHWAAHQDRLDQILSRPTAHLVAAARIAPADRVLDVGCGCGATTRIAARRASRGSALGVDLSGPMLERARERAGREGIGNIAFERADAQVTGFPGEPFDVVVSRFGVMFFDDPGAAFANLFRSLRSGGRIAFLCWQERERSQYFTVPIDAVASLVPPPEPDGSPAGPFSLADPGRTRALLGDAGFAEIAVDPVAEPVRVGSDAGDAAKLLLGMGSVRAMLADAGEATVARAAHAMRDAVRPYETPDGVLLGSSAWLVTASRP